MVTQSDGGSIKMRTDVDNNLFVITLLRDCVLSLGTQAQQPGRSLAYERIS